MGLSGRTWTAGRGCEGVGEGRWASVHVWRLQEGARRVCVCVCVREVKF